MKYLDWYCNQYIWATNLGSAIGKTNESNLQYLRKSNIDSQGFYMYLVTSVTAWE